MSHFTVLVKLAASAAIDLNEAIAAAMAPYQENNCGDCPEEYLVFKEQETEMREKYEVDTSEMVLIPDVATFQKAHSEFLDNAVAKRMGDKGLFYQPPSRAELDNRKAEELARVSMLVTEANGEPVYISVYDDIWRYPGTVGFSSGSHGRPEGLEVVEQPMTDRYATFEEYAADYHGCTERDEKHGCFGYYENPNAKWDYFQVGGRWGGKFTDYVNAIPHICGEANPDVVRVKDLNLDRIREATVEGACKEWERVEKYDYGRGKEKYGHPFDTPRRTLMDLGFIKCVHEEIDVPEDCFYFEKVRDNLFDIYEAEVAKDEFMRRYAENGCPIKTYAVLETNGEWAAPGDMGWWGISHAESEDNLKYNKGWLAEFIEAEDPDTVLTLVDCHI